MRWGREVGQKRERRVKERSEKGEERGLKEVSERSEAEGERVREE